MNNLGQNTLVGGHSLPYRLRKRNRKAPVTIILCIQFDFGIVVATDSRTTNPDGTIRDNAEKVRVIGTGKRPLALVAGAGSNEVFHRILEAIEPQDPKVLKQRRGIPDAIEVAVAQLKQQIRKQFHGTAEELQRHFSDYNCELLIAYFHNDEPCVYTLDFALGAAIRRTDRIVAMGCGATLADFLLNTFDRSNLRFGQALGMAGYVIEEVKAFDPRCGGKTSIGMIMNNPKRRYQKAGMLDAGWTSQVMEVVNEMRPKMRKQLSQFTMRVVKKIAERSKH